jgi:hypothetical protein
MSNKKEIPKSKLHKKTIILINAKIRKSKNRTEALEELSNETGLSFPWLDYFARNPDRSASVDRVEALYNNLSGKRIAP